MSLAHSHGIFPLVYRTIKRYDHLLSEENQVSMKTRYINIIKQNLLMTSELIKVMKLINQSNINAITFKGPILSHMAYGDLVSRQYVDLDILVNINDINSVQKLLKDNNYEELHNLDEYQKENLKELVHDIAFVNKTNGINVELHWTLTSSEFFIDLEKLEYLKNIKKYNINNNEINIFSNEKLFIYLCVHGYKHLWERIEWLVDIYYLIEKENIDLENVIKLSKLIDADRIVLSTLIICENLFDLDIRLKYLTTEDKKLNKVTNKMLNKILKDYMSINEKIHSKKFSKTHLYMLKTKENQIKYLKSFLNPTEYDYEKVKISSKFHFLYYLLRPFNIIIKSFNHRFNKNK